MGFGSISWFQCYLSLLVFTPVICSCSRGNVSQWADVIVALCIQNQPCHSLISYDYVMSLFLFLFLKLLAEKHLLILNLHGFVLS